MKHDIRGLTRNQDGNANDDGSEKSHFRFAVYFFVLGISILFLYLKLC